MKKFFIFAIVVISLIACDKHNAYVLFDTPFVTITDESEMLSEMTVTNEAHNFLTTLRVRLNVSDKYYQEPITINYKFVCGDGLQEDVDYKINKSVGNTLVFKDKEYVKYIDVVWMKNPNFDPSPASDSSLVVVLDSSSLPEMVLGNPGTNNKMKSFKFIKSSN